LHIRFQSRSRLISMLELTLSSDGMGTGLVRTEEGSIVNVDASYLAYTFANT